MRKSYIIGATSKNIVVGDMKAKTIASLIVTVCVLLAISAFSIPMASAQQYYAPVGGEILPSPLFTLVYVIIGFIIVAGLTLAALFKRGMLRLPS